MSWVLRVNIFFGLAACLGLGLLSLGAAEVPASDLAPLTPLMRTLFISNNNPGTLRDIDESGGDYSGTVSSTGNSHAISADGKWLLLTNGSNFMLCDLAKRNHTQLRALEGGTVNLDNSFCVLSPDVKILAVTPQQFNGEDMAIRFFDTVTGKQLREIDNDQQIFGLAFSPDGKRLAVGTEQHVELWNAEDGEDIRGSGAQNGNYRLLTFSPDGKMIAALGVESDTVHIWETATCTERTTVAFSTPPGLLGGGRRGAMRAMAMQGMRAMRIGLLQGANNGNDNILTLAFSTDSRLLAVSKTDGAIHLWDLQTQQELPPLTGFRGSVNAMAFSPDGKELIAVDTEGTRLTWRMTALKRSWKIRLAALEDADFAELWEDLAEPDAFRVYRARRHLINDPKRAIPLLSRHLKPVPAGDTARIEKLVKDLASPSSGTRRKAMTELRTKHGEAALGALMQLNGGNGGMVPPGMIQAIPGGAAGPGGDNQAAMLLLQKLQAQYGTPERQRDVLAVQILGEIATPEARKILATLSKGAAGVELTTTSKAALDRLAAADKEKPRSSTAEGLWTQLSNSDAAQAYQAMCRLTAAPDQATALFRKELKPIQIVEDKEIAALVDKLSSDEFKVREEATEALGKIGETALAMMRKALSKGVGLEARKRLQRLVEQASSQTSPTHVRSLRAIEVLEQTGLPEAREILRTVAAGAPQAQITCEAKASLERLARR